jgi:hypothetical protein
MLEWEVVVVKDSNPADPHHRTIIPHERHSFGGVGGGGGAAGRDLEHKQYCQYTTT